MKDSLEVKDIVVYLGEHECKNESVHTLRNALHDKLELNKEYEIEEVHPINTYPIRLKGKNYFHPESIFKFIRKNVETNGYMIDKSLIMSSPFDDEDLEKAPVKPIIINATKKEEPAPKRSSLSTIIDKDIDFGIEVIGLLDYLASTYSDKYESEDNGFNPKEILLSKEGKASNMKDVAKYLRRYNTSGYSKSENTEDILKSIHYLLFELQRKTKHA